HLVGNVPVHLAAAGGDYLAVPLDEARLAVGHFVRAVRLGLWDAVLFDVLPRGRGADGHRLDYQRVELRRGPRGWELFAGAAVVPPPAQSPGPAGALPAPAGLIPFQNMPIKKDIQAAAWVSFSLLQIGLHLLGQA